MKLVLEVTCRRCSSEKVKRNGSVKGRAKYACKACSYQGYFEERGSERAAKYALVEKLLLERNSQRSIVRITGVSRMTIAKIIKKSEQ